VLGTGRCVECELYVDGASLGNPGPAGYGYVIRCEDGIHKASGHIGVTTNNVAEYRALIEGLRRCLELGCRRVRVCSDSELLVKQLRGDYRVRSRNLIALHGEALELMRSFESVEVVHVSRELNVEADRLAKSAAKTGTGETRSRGR